MKKKDEKQTTGKADILTVASDVGPYHYLSM